MNGESVQGIASDHLDCPNGCSDAYGGKWKRLLALQGKLVDCGCILGMVVMEVVHEPETKHATAPQICCRVRALEPHLFPMVSSCRNSYKLSFRRELN